MREIKFRAWDEMNKKMINFDHNDLHDYYLEMDYWSKAHLVTIEEVSGYQPYMDKKYVNDIVLMQYTGLKDKNGVEIYEGDIVESNWGYRFPIFFEDGCYKTDSEDFEVISENLINYYELKVIGNIYENPELLGDSK